MTRRGQQNDSKGEVCTRQREQWVQMSCGRNRFGVFEEQTGGRVTVVPRCRPHPPRRWPVSSADLSGAGYLSLALCCQSGKLCWASQWVENSCLWGFICGVLELFLHVFPENRSGITGSDESLTPPHQKADPLPSVLQVDPQDPLTPCLRHWDGSFSEWSWGSRRHSDPPAPLQPCPDQGHLGCGRAYGQPLMSEQGILPGHPPEKRSHGRLVWEAQVSLYWSWGGCLIGKEHRNPDKDNLR